jgi:tetratricopeptide (TPR) repeat protein
MYIKYLISFLLIFTFFTNCKQDKPETVISKPETAISTPSRKENVNLPWAKFVENYPKEIKTAEGIYTAMVQNGLKENSLTPMNFTFVSDEQVKLERLSAFMGSHYPYTLEKTRKNGDIWELSGQTNKIPITSENLKYWALDMYIRGSEYDAIFDTYNGLVGKEGQIFPLLVDSVQSYYAKKAMICYEKGDISGTIINFNLDMLIFPNNPNTFYKLAVAKNDLYAWKEALNDYTTALTRAPDFISALNNRGTLLDEHGNPAAAIDDFNKILTIPKATAKDKMQAYFNRGNTKFNAKDKKGACEDFKIAMDMGMKEAEARLKEDCK